MAEKQRSASETYDHDARWARALAGRLQAIAVVLEMHVDPETERALREELRELRGRIERNPEFSVMALVDLLDAIQELADLAEDDHAVERYAPALAEKLAEAYPSQASNVKIGAIRAAMVAARSLRGRPRDKTDRYWEIVELQIAPAFVPSNAITSTKALRHLISKRRKGRDRVPELLRGPELLGGPLVRKIVDGIL